MLDKYVSAFERYDVSALVTLFSEDAVWEMPPFTGWYQTPADIARLISNACPAKHPGDLRLLPTQANGQPAFGMYYQQNDRYEAFQLHVLDIVDGAISHVTAFFDVSLFETFGLPGTLPLGS